MTGMIRALAVLIILNVVEDYGHVGWPSGSIRSPPALKKVGRPYA
ncbi:hypothetical protein HNP83_006522 [Rhizobium leguminosarum]|nr:hypothetical protein [Rhizobium leguminosarum]